MAEKTYKGTGALAASDVKYVKWVGKTKSGVAVSIEMPKAICRSNPDWTFAEKDDVVASVEFEGLYSDTALADGDMTEPWTIKLGDGTVSGNDSIVLGAGKFYVGASSAAATCVGLTRGGGKFTVERTIREINADDDPGAVEGRLDMTEARPKLSLNALQWLAHISDLYVGIAEAT